MRSEARQRRHAADRRARAGRAALLLQRDRRRQAVDRVDVGHADLVDQPARVRRDRLEVAPLRLGVERAERERRLARARDAARTRPARRAGCRRRRPSGCARARRARERIGSCRGRPRAYSGVASTGAALAPGLAPLDARLPDQAGTDRHRRRRRPRHPLASRSPAIRRPRRRRRAARHLVGGWPLFGLLWPSGAQLAARLGARPVTPGERILEIGCGLALASLVAPPPRRRRHGERSPSADRASSSPRTCA